MGFLDSLWGGSINGNLAALPGGGAGKLSAVLNNMSELQAIQSMLSFLGTDQQSFLQNYTLDKKAGKKAFKENPLGVAKVGGTYYDIGGLLGQKADLAAQADKKALSNAQAKYESLKQQPMLATLAAQAEGNFDSNFTTAVDDMFQKVISKNLGAGAAQGFLNDPNKQAALTQPAAVAQAKYLQDYKQAAQGTLQGLAGLPQTTAFNPNILAGPQSAAYYLPGVMNAASMIQGNNQFNSQLQFQQGMAQNQAAMNFAKFSAGLAAGAFGGGFGGAGGAGAAAGGATGGYGSPFFGGNPYG